MKIFKKLLLVLAATAGLAVLMGVGYFARERYQNSGPLVVRNFVFGGKTADEVMAFLVKALNEKDTEAAQRLFSEENKEGYASWVTILQTNKDNDLLGTMSKSISAAVPYGEATTQLKRFALINKLKTEALIFSVAPNAKLGLWQISDLARAQLTKRK
ncbi:MAG: hypothetical protein G01um10143_111 [Parcubacteria group bacterium Gr01-1014_3]|nr:MAG: hypothetical protein G01um10143_111 [Parcubacteria group bacterium Gr01-1014_3]